VSGTADIKWNVGDALFTATAAITGDLPGAVRPWHVHFGVCPNSGQIVGPSGSYPALVVDQNGFAEITTTVAFELDAAVPYSVNIHESESALAHVIACGDLEVIAGGGGGGSGGDDGGGGGGGY